jgi:hypothetical protein
MHGRYVKPANLKEDRIDRRFARNQNGKRKVVVVIRERGGIWSRRYSIRKVRPPHSSALASPRARSFTPTKRRLGTIYMSVSRSRESIIRRHTASMALALTWLRNTSHASDVPRSAFTTTSRARTSSDTLRSRHGGKITAASRMAIR